MHDTQSPPLIESLEQRTFLSAHPATLDQPPANEAAIVMRKVSASPTVINHSSIAGVSKLSQTVMNRIATAFNFFFAHASVGGNIVDGMRALRASNAKRYRLAVVSDDDTPPAKTVKGRVYEYDRGNPSWQEKVDTFAACMNGGWAGKVNVAINKFCFIDPDVTLAYYAQGNAAQTAMSQLEAKYPAVKFVYTTIPLTTDSDTDNVKRNKFNIALRNWCKANNKALLDIADIEAWTPGGTQAVFKKSGKTYQKLYSGYTDDGGHLNPTASKRVALAWYALAAKML
jgi:hypothetical protein